MAKVELTINGRRYTVGCGDGQEARLLELASYMDDKVRSIGGGDRSTSESQLLVMAGLLLADEVYELRETLTSSHAGPAATIAPDQAQQVTEQINRAAQELENIAGRLDHA